MRNLTIKRAESDVGSQKILTVYIEDPESGEATVNGVSCRKIGELKNGEKKTFEIEEGSLKLLATVDGADSAGRGIAFLLPEGSEDVSLSLKPHPGHSAEKEEHACKSGDDAAEKEADEEDTDDGETAVEKTVRRPRRGLVVFIVAFAAVLIAGLVAAGFLLPKKTVREKTFSADGMTVTLTDEFKRETRDGYTLSYTSKDAGLFAVKEPFELAEKFEERTPEQYADMMIASDGLTGVEKVADGDAIRWENDYVAPDTGKIYRCHTYVYKTSDAFWMIRFSTLKEKDGEYGPKIESWAKTVKFAD
ncbi:MAG: hypothetical protein IKR53_05385 [Clostridia bacterium]|nr:hypothetical protein [Clostridia bacterium]MBR6290859.1 hypothetical protein [Clostridia bacterium]